MRGGRNQPGLDLVQADRMPNRLRKMAIRSAGSAPMHHFTPDRPMVRSRPRSKQLIQRDRPCAGAPISLIHRHGGVIKFAHHLLKQLGPEGTRHGSPRTGRSSRSHFLKHSSQPGLTKQCILCGIGAEKGHAWGSIQTVPRGYCPQFAYPTTSAFPPLPTFRQGSSRGTDPGPTRWSLRIRCGHPLLANK